MIDTTTEQKPPTIPLVDGSFGHDLLELLKSIEVWSDSNGLLLIPSIDHLFDRGFISFDDAGETLISPIADTDSLWRMGVNPEKPPYVGTFNSDQKHFLSHHRTAVFLAGVAV